MLCLVQHQTRAVAKISPPDIALESKPPAGLTPGGIPLRGVPFSKYVPATQVPLKRDSSKTEGGPAFRFISIFMVLLQ
jgi:hypothetical protein